MLMLWNAIDGCAAHQAELTRAALVAGAAALAAPASLGQPAAMGVQDLITAVKGVKLDTLRL